MWINPSQRWGPKVVFGALAYWYHLVGKSVSAVGYEINNHNFPLSLVLPRKVAVTHNGGTWNLLYIRALPLYTAILSTCHAAHFSDQDFSKTMVVPPGPQRHSREVQRN